LLTAGLPDPLATYERAFVVLGDESQGCHREGELVALRFSDPLGRRDTAGRVIPHDFVVFGDAAKGVASVEDGLRLVWPVVADVFAQVWDADGPPSAADLFPG
jgi:hypothetical protein